MIYRVHISEVIHEDFFKYTDVEADTEEEAIELAKEFASDEFIIEDIGECYHNVEIIRTEEI